MARPGQRKKYFLCDVLRGSVYDDKFVRESMTPSGPNNCQDPPKITTSIPYIEGFRDDISQICRKFNIFRPACHHHQKTASPSKRPFPAEKRTGVVYEVPCSCGKVYIGETIRTLETRIKEHKRACRDSDYKKSAIAEHTWTE